ncbi:MAG: UDP-N-acetylenolpyruvoylglucosamine reductase [Micavibrio sp.]|nr:UDP-N-acetylenolpyruvoylglucosamine reductase [Micavibrio sp.]|tara:strand:- start:4342 stop:5271 length:930 start_codon:yes stop_codon:yes gene_type:complete
MSDIFEKLRGAVTRDADIGAQSWFRTGGRADILFCPADIDDLQDFLGVYPAGKPLTIIGGLANTIVRDGGIRGVTVQLGKSFADIAVKDNRYIEAGCGALNGSLAAAAVKAGIGGLEFLSGIPGSLGGALAMNAGAYGSEMKDVLVGAVAMSRSGDIKRYTADDLHMSYRHSEIPHGDILIGATLRGVAEDYETVKARMNQIKARRNETQPIREKTGGSTFANPSLPELRVAGLPKETKAWQVVEKVGGRGLKRGGAQISEKHCNFMINAGGATAADLEGLGDEIINRAHRELGLKLRWEIKRIGEFSA